MSSKFFTSKIDNKVNKYKMDIKQIYREETDLEPFHKSYGDYGSYDDKYVKWLEEAFIKLKQNQNDESRRLDNI